MDDAELQKRIEQWQSKVMGSDNGFMRDMRSEMTERVRAASEGLSDEAAAAKFGVPITTIRAARPQPEPVKAKLPEVVITPDDRAANRELQADIHATRAALERLRAQTPSTPARDSDPARDQFQRKADLLAELRPMLAADEEERFKTKLAKKAMKRLAK
ncbi:MAG TPA: hypothetical protein VGM06_01805 [Polyangiaceae bacterium]|jgi:hypothetical protein